MIFTATLVRALGNSLFNYSSIFSLLGPLPREDITRQRDVETSSAALDTDKQEDDSVRIRHGWLFLEQAPEPVPTKCDRIASPLS
jgi:hypothetical protein